MKYFINLMREFHPQWEFKFFSDRDARDFVQSEFPEYLELYDCYPRPVLKADLFRLLAVYRLGGFYLDTDFLLHKKLDPLCREKVVFAFEHEIDERKSNLRYPRWLRISKDRLTLANYAVGAEAGHPFLAAILDESVYQTQTFEVEDCVDLDILHATGPDAVNSVYYRNREPKNEFSEKKNSPSARPCRRRRRNSRNSSKNPVEKPTMNSSDTSPNPSVASNALTRRNFMKKSALTVGTITILGQGMALAVGTSKCPVVDLNGISAHTSGCEWIKRVDVKFTSVMDPHPSPGDVDACGRVFLGTLKYKIGHTGGGADTDSEDIPVSSGGFIAGKTEKKMVDGEMKEVYVVPFQKSNRHLVQGPSCDTAVKGGNYVLGRQPDGVILGFDLVPQPSHRSEIEVHYKVRDHGTSGCIAFLDKAGSKGHWDKFNQLMSQWKTPCINDNDKEREIPITIVYENVSRTPVWESGHQNGDTGTCTAC